MERKENKIKTIIMTPLNKRKDAYDTLISSPLIQKRDGKKDKWSNKETRLRQKFI